MKVWRIYLALAGLGATPALASRPVFHTVSLENLVERSQAIIVARASNPLYLVTPIPIGQNGQLAKPFDLHSLRFEVLEVLYAYPGLALRSGQTVVATSSNWSLEFEERYNFTLHNRTTSYPAENYRYMVHTCTWGHTHGVTH